METVPQEIHRNLIEQSLAGNEHAQYELYSLYSGAMYNICLRMLCHRENAEDILQESFAEAFKNLSKFRYESTFGVWLKRIVINRCINSLKKKRVKLIFSDDLIDYEDKVEEIDYSEIHFQVERIKEAMQKLPEGYRIILSLYLFEGYDHKEISEILDISESTSKTQYLRAKLRIRDLLKNMI